MKANYRRSNPTIFQKHLGFWMILVLAIAFFLRVYDIGSTPLGLHYDEAANVILSDEIAQGAWPIFIRGYTGKEVLYFYLASLMIRLIGSPLIAVRLASAFIGTVSVAVTYRMTREMFRKHPEEKAGHTQKIALIAATLHAANLWAITTSRLGFRALTQPLFQSLTILFLWRGLHHSIPVNAGDSKCFNPTDRQQPAKASVPHPVIERLRSALDWILAGLFCGLSAYTYLAIRAFPLLLASFLLWMVIAVPGSPARQRGRQRIQDLWHIGLFLLAATLVFCPLGLFYLKNPQYFVNRIGQVSVFSAQAGNDPWATFWHAVKVSLGVFIQQGDRNWRFNVSGAPALWWPVAVFFVIGLLASLWRLFKPATQSRLFPSNAVAENLISSDLGSGVEALAGLQRGAFLLLLLWLPIMLLPSILGGQDVEISLSLRAIGVLPALYIWPALGIVEIGTWLRHSAPTTFSTLYRLLIAIVLLASVVYAGIQCFAVWGPSIGNYYAASSYLVDAANYLNAHLPDDALCYVAAEHYRHPTIALLANNYTRFKWLIGPDAFVFPASGEQETWVIFTYEAMPPEDTLLRIFGSLGQAHLAPDGQVAFRIYRFAPGQIPTPQPDVPADANLGNTLRFLGYDVNAPAISGQSFDARLYFEILHAVDRDDYAFFVHLVDDAGFQWGGDTFFTYPSGQWTAGETLILRFVSPIWVGAPPGKYALAVGAYSPSLDARLPLLNERGQMSGTTIKIEPLDIARAPSLPDNLPPIAQEIDIPIGETLTLIGSDRIPRTLRPGAVLNLSLYWQSTVPANAAQASSCASCTVLLWLEPVDAQVENGQQTTNRIQLWNGSPVRGQYPFSQWQQEEFVRDHYALRLPIDMPDGAFALNLQVASSAHDRPILLGTIDVEATDRLWEPPPFDYPVGARLSDKVELLGYTLDRQQAAPGDTLHLTLIWQALKEMDTAYTVFTHLLDENQQIRGQKDNPPQNGSYPTTLWAREEVIVDEYEIVIQDGTPPGKHTIEIGMYDPGNLQRLPVFDPTGAIGDRILLGEVIVSDN
ncbi:MAG: hypothetical protein JXA89_17640 [Anaerolineae bacterium]|nr:hypothetical protein [Anaerolineae bacterium]